jgi:twitching motility protein PilT
MLVALLQATVDAGSSDLHLTIGRPATVRRDGVLVPFENVEVLTTEDIERMVMSVVPPDRKSRSSTATARSTSRSV